MAKAKQRQEIERGNGVARALIAQYEGTVEDDPLANLRHAVRTAAVVEAVYRDLVSSLPEGLGELIDTGAATGFERKPHPWVKDWKDAIKLLADVSRSALAAGVAERMVQIAADEGTYIVSVIIAVLDLPALHLDPEQKRAARKAAADHLRIVGPAG